MRVRFRSKGELLCGRLTGRRISGKYEVKTADGTYHYVKCYDEVKKC